VGGNPASGLPGVDTAVDPFYVIACGAPSRGVIAMLGRQLGGETGQVTGTRVLPSADGPPKIEVSFQATGRLLDVDVTDMGTYVATPRPDGTLFGEGQGCVMTTDGELVSWVGSGVGRFLGRGSAVAWRGAIYYQTSSPKLALLNTVAGMYEYETDESGKTDARMFEWK
jgi:hypothetical protein